MFLKDSVFSPIIAQFQSKSPHPFADDEPLMPAKEITSSLDKLENNFANSVMTIVSAEADKLWKKLQGTKKIEEINNAQWNVVSRLQQLTWFLWRDGWQLGQTHGNREVNQAQFSAPDFITFADDEPEDVVQVDARIKKRDRRLKVSKQLGNQAAVVSDFNIPLEQSVLKQAVEERTLSLAKDVDETTLKEIKTAIRGSVVPDEKLGRTLTPKEVEGRINLALGRQANRGEAPRTTVEKVGGGGFFSRARLIARTELSGAYTTARLSSFQAAGVTHVRWVSMEDLQRCARCASRHGMVVAISDVATIAANPIPLHPNCRCIWTPVKNDGDGDRMKKDPDRSPGGRWLIPIAASWVDDAVIGLAAATGILPNRERQKQKEQQKQIRNLILGAGAGALSLAALYFLVLRNPQFNQNLRNIGQDLQSRARAEINENIRSSISNDYDRTPQPVQQPESPQEIDNSNRLIVAGVNINDATTEQLIQLFGFNTRQAPSIRRYIRRGNQINNFDDLQQVPGIGRASIARVAARMSQVRPNLNAVPNSRAAANELAAQLGVSPRVAQAILDERDRNGAFADAQDLTRRLRSRLPRMRIRLGRRSIERIIQNAEVGLPAPEIASDIQQVGTGRGATEAPITRNRPRIQNPAPEAPPSEKFNQLDRNYQQLSDQVDDYRSTVNARIPNSLQEQATEATARQSKIVRQQTNIYTQINQTVSRIPDEIDELSSQIEAIENAYTDFLNPTNEPYFQSTAKTSKAINRKINKIERALSRSQNYEDRALGLIDEQLQELQDIRQRIIDSVDTGVNNIESLQLGADIRRTYNQVNQLGNTPATEQLMQQLDDLVGQLDINRDRTVESINAQIGRLEQLAENIRQDTAAVNQQIAASKYKLEQLRDRLQSVPTSASQLSPRAREAYKESVRLGRQIRQTQQQLNEINSLISQGTPGLTNQKAQLERRLNGLTRLAQDFKNTIWRFKLHNLKLAKFFNRSKLLLPRGYHKGVI